MLVLVYCCAWLVCLIGLRRALVSSYNEGPTITVDRRSDFISTDPSCDLPSILSSHRAEVVNLCSSPSAAREPGSCDGAERSRPRCQEAGGPGVSCTQVQTPDPPARPCAREVACSGGERYLHLPLLSVQNSEGHRGFLTRGLGREGGNEIKHAGGVRHVRRAWAGMVGLRRFTRSMFISLPFFPFFACQWDG